MPECWIIAGPNGAGKTTFALAALQRAVAQALETKRRLGQHAVVWKDGQVVILAAEEIPPMGASPADSSPMPSPCPGGPAT